MVTLPPLTDKARIYLLGLPEYQQFLFHELRDMARALPGGSRVNLTDRAAIIAFLLGSRDEPQTLV